MRLAYQGQLKVNPFASLKGGQNARVVGLPFEPSIRIRLVAGIDADSSEG